MKTPKNTKSEEIKQQVTKVGVINICSHCKGDIAVRNPSGYCDHLYYPENCKTCGTPQEQKSLLDSIISWEELKDEEVPHDYEEMIVAVGRNNLRQQIRNRLIKELK